MTEREKLVNAAGAYHEFQTDGDLSALLDAAHAYGVAVGREGFHDAQAVFLKGRLTGYTGRSIWDALTGEQRGQLLAAAGRLGPDDHPYSPGALRASIDATGRAVDDHEGRLARAESLLTQPWGINAVMLQDHEGRIASLEATVGTIGGWADARISALERSTAETADRRLALGAVVDSLHYSVCKRADEIAALTERVHSLEPRVSDLEEGLEAPGIAELKAALEREKAEHAVTLSRYEERVAEVERLQASVDYLRNESMRAIAHQEALKQTIAMMLKHVPDDLLREAADEPPF